MALGEFGPNAKDAVPHLIEALKESLKLKEGDPRNIDISVVRALWKIGPDAEKAVPLLLSIANNKAMDRTTRDVMIRDSAQRALKAISEGSKDLRGKQFPLPFRSHL